MKYRNLAFVVVMMTVIFCLNGRAQYLDRAETKSTSLYTGDVRTDLMMMPDVGSLLSTSDSSRIPTMHTNKYSPLRAGLYSAVIPGAGQFYTKSYLQSALFAGAEVALWIFYSKYQTKGDQKTQEFQDYADANYSVVRYVEWIQKYYPLAWLKQRATPDDYTIATSIYGTILNGSTSSHPWDQVNWIALNTYEELIGKNSSSSDPTGFSHKLPFRPDQQYYELIGKYPQFAGGWDDAIDALDPSKTITAQMVAMVNAQVSQHFLDYRNMRGDANSYYNIATTMTYVLVANHVLGALEAAWNAAHLNSQLHASSSVQPRNVDGYHVELAYTMNLQVEF
jgi:hypothetical protein